MSIDITEGTWIVSTTVEPDPATMQPWEQGIHEKLQAGPMLVTVITSDVSGRLDCVELGQLVSHLPTELRWRRP